VIAALEISELNDAALACAVRPSEDREDGQASHQSLVPFPQHFVIPVPRRAIDKADLKFSTVRKLLDVQTARGI
jgi:hypothetical protein